MREGQRIYIRVGGGEGWKEVHTIFSCLIHIALRYTKKLSRQYGFDVTPSLWHLEPVFHKILTCGSNLSVVQASSANICTDESSLMVTDPLLTINRHKCIV